MPVTDPSPALPLVEQLSADDQAAVLDLDQWAFGFDDENIDPEPVAATFEWDRVFGVRSPDGTGLIATNLAFSLALPVPGGEVPCAGLTWVSVHPRHRRQGILRAMITRHLRTVHERGEPVSALYAAEAGIYGRFGYGTATWGLQLTVPRAPALRDVPGWREVGLRLERVDVERHADLVGACHDAARPGRPGLVSRPSPGLRRHVLSDQPSQRKGGESLRLLLAEADDDGVPRGYALFRRHHAWSATGPDGTVRVRELIARDPAAHRALWGCLLDLDLTVRVETSELPVDDPLLHLLVDSRAAAPRITDGVWLRLVDVPAALAARRYAGEIDVVLEVGDELCPWNAGNWHLTGGPDGAMCVPTTARPELRLDVRELGAAYLGGTSLTALAAAGLVTGEPATLLRTASAFGWPVAPWNSWIF